MAITLDSADIKPFHHCRKFNRTALARRTVFGGDGKQKCSYLLKDTVQCRVGNADWGNKGSLSVESMSNHVTFKRLSSAIPEDVWAGSQGEFLRMSLFY